MANPSKLKTTIHLTSVFKKGFFYTHHQFGKTSYLLYEILRNLFLNIGAYNLYFVDMNYSCH